jgi:hypothetical protein
VIEDVKALQGAAPWLRMRVGDYRIIYRPLSKDELAQAVEETRASGDEPEASEGYLVQRIVHRRDLERAVASLPGP